MKHMGMSAGVEITPRTGDEIVCLNLDILSSLVRQTDLSPVH